MASTRPSIVGQDSGPEAPYPLHMEGSVISGFGRGSKELGIPTANLPVDESLTPWISTVKSGVYFGYASLSLPTIHPDADSNNISSAQPDAVSSSRFQVFPMVMSIGYNPFYKNTVRSAEVHVLHTFNADFYDAHMRLLILGFIREEKDYKSLEALVEDINFDCEVAKNSLKRQSWTPAANGAEGSLNAEWLVRPL